MPTVASIKRAVADHYDLPIEAMTRRCTLKREARPRHLAVYLATRLTRHSYVRIGQLFDRDHSTVMHAMHQTEKRLRADPKIEAAARSVTHRLLLEDAA
jgi:chromosomal replication initiator protein